MEKLLINLQQDYPNLQFQPAKTFYWSPKQQAVFYNPLASDTTRGTWSLLHELAHGLLAHQDFTSDFELLQIEIEAWEKAKIIAGKYDAQIDEDHIQDCLDTYRDWLYARSSCPHCTACGIQTQRHTYHCLNCGGEWRVSQSRLCRPYRRKVAKS